MSTLTTKAKPKSFLAKFSEKHWFAPDTPTSEARFQVNQFLKWLGIYVGLPAIGFSLAIFIFSAKEKKAPNSSAYRIEIKFDGSKSQIIDFRNPTQNTQYGSYVKRATGTLVRVRLLNVVESGGPVHAQITDSSLGRNLMGGTLLGESANDVNLDRITINFNLVKDPTQSSVAIPIRARAIAFDGTLGLNANKKEGMLARSSINAGAKLSQDANSMTDSFDIRYIFLKALGVGFLGEVGGELNVEKNRASLLTLNPRTEFFAELTDFFPGSNK